MDESLQKVEKEQKAMEAVLVRMNSSQNGERESSPEDFHVCCAIPLEYLYSRGIQSILDGFTQNIQSRIHRDTLLVNPQ